MNLRSILPLLPVVALIVPSAGASSTAREETAMRNEEPEAHTVFDFGTDAEPWPSIDDVVMGGVSESEMTVSDGVAIFRGNLSLENNGGFASVRSRPADHRALDGHNGLLVRVRGDSRTYGFRLRTTAAFDGVSYQATLPTEAGEWTEVRLPFDAFEPVFRGRRVPGHPALDPAEIKTFGVIIADKNPGAFRLEIDRIQAY